MYIPKGTRIQCYRCNKILYEVIMETEYLSARSVKALDSIPQPINGDLVECPFCREPLTDTLDLY